MGRPPHHTHAHAGLTGVIPSWLEGGARLRRWFGGLALLAAASCAHDARLEVPQESAHARPIPVPRATGPAPHEVLQAEVELLGLPLGSLESSSCRSEAGTIIETHVEPAALINALHRSGGDARTELLGSAPRLSDYHIQDGDLLRHYQIEHRAGAFDYLYDNGGEARRVGHGAVPEGEYPHDLQSALVLLRSWRPRLGEVGYFYVVLGRRLWRVEVTAAGPQVIRAQGVPQLTQRLDGVSVRLWQPSEVEPRRFSLWLSEDQARAPLRMVADASFGEVTLTLTGRREESAPCQPSRSE
jgi:hypothetical protein